MFKWLEKLWKWVLSFFKKNKNDKTPSMKITIITLLFLFNLQAQRTEVQYVYAHFIQPTANNINEWVITYNEDTTNVLRNDSIKVSFWKNNEWVFISSENDSLAIYDSVKILIDKPFKYDVEYIFSISAKNSNGITTSGSVGIYYIVSDLNSDYTVDGEDLMTLSRNWGRTSLQYSDWFDITGDGKCDGADLTQMSKDFTRTY